MTDQLTVMNTETGVEKQDRSAMDIATTRAAQEIQAAMVIAKRFPRDVNEAYTKILQSCKRKGIAEEAEYAFPRGDTRVTGPSIRLAEVLAQNWGNMDFGIIELEQKTGESSVMAYAWDLETNSRQTKVFTVKHERHTKRGTKFLSDPRDIYEMTANQGARRLRACILGVIPKDIADDAVTECNKTLKAGHAESLEDRVRKMVSAFKDFGVTQAMIETRLKHKVETASEQDLIALRKVYTAIKDNMGNADAYFEREPKADDGKSGVDGLKKKLSKTPESKEEPAKEQDQVELERLAKIKLINTMLQNKPKKQEKVDDYLTMIGAKTIAEIGLDDAQELIDNIK